MTRRVVLICGPAGAGKTTLARSLGLEVYDMDDPQWSSARQFNQALTALGRQPDAQAAVIRSGATRASRGKAALQVGATETIILDTDEQTCKERIKARARVTQPIHRQIIAAHDWWAKYEPDDPGDIAGPTSEAW